MGQTKRLFFIYNPCSGRGLIRTKLFGILQVFSDAGYEMTVHPTRACRDAVEQIRTSNPQVLADRLLERALAAGAEDDCTVLVMRLFAR